MIAQERSRHSLDEMLEKIRELWACTTNKPVRRLRNDHLELYAKLECGGFSGSVKDRAALGMLENALLRGEIGPETVIVESTSGNLGLALASACRLAGLRFIAVVDPLINPNTETRLRRLCFEVLKVSERDASDGYLLNRRKCAFEQSARFEYVFFPNQYENPDNYRAYYHTLGRELCEQVPDPDYVFVAVSSGGTITGVSRRIKETYPDAKVIAVDVEGSVIFGGAPKRRHVTGLGSSLIPSVLGHARIDEALHVPEAEIIDGCHRLLHDQAVFAGASSGACYAAILKYFARRPAGRERPRVVFICPDAGDAYLSTIYNPDWIANVSKERSGRGNRERGEHALP